MKDLYKEQHQEPERKSNSRDEKKARSHRAPVEKQAGPKGGRAAVSEYQVTGMKCESHKSGRKRLKQAEVVTGAETLVLEEQELAEHVRGGGQLYSLVQDQKEYLDLTVDEIGLVLLAVTSPAVGGLLVESGEAAYAREGKEHHHRDQDQVPPVLPPETGGGSRGGRPEHQVTCITREREKSGRKGIARVGIKDGDKVKYLGERALAQRVREGDRFYLEHHGRRTFLDIDLGSGNDSYIEGPRDHETYEALEALEMCPPSPVPPLPFLAPMLGLLGLLLVCAVLFLISKDVDSTRIVKETVIATVVRPQTVIAEVTRQVTVEHVTTQIAQETVVVPQTVIVPQTVPAEVTVQVPVTVVVPAITRVPVMVTPCRETPPVLPTETPSFGGQTLVQNGSFEDGFNANGVGRDWFAFDNGGDYVGYGYHDDTWAKVVGDGCHSELIEIDTTHFAGTTTNRSAGIAQTLTGLVANARYQLSMEGEIRTSAGDVNTDNGSYRAQWGIVPGGSTNWSAVTDWHDIPWTHVFQAATGGPMSSYSVQFVAPAYRTTLFIRLLKGPAVAGTELEMNLDDISLVGPR